MSKKKKTIGPGRLAGLIMPGHPASLYLAISAPLLAPTMRWLCTSASSLASFALCLPAEAPTVASSSKLNSHLRLHSEYALTCVEPGCPYASKFSSNMVRHRLLMHTGQRGFACAVPAEQSKRQCSRCTLIPTCRRRRGPLCAPRRGAGTGAQASRTWLSTRRGEGAQSGGFVSAAQM